jgi:hypothetical protein
MQGGVLGVHTRIGFSATLSPLSYLRINQLKNVRVPSLEPDKVDISTHGSIWKRNMPGMLTVGDMEITILQDLDATSSPEQDQLFTLQAAGTTVGWRAEVPNQRGAPTSWTPFTFNGWVFSILPGSTIAEAQLLVVTVTFDGTSFTKGMAGASLLN